MGSDPKVLAPKYLFKFSCIGTECEDNCCLSNWKVPVDKSTFNKYMQIEDPELRRNLGDNIKRKHSPTDVYFAEIRFNKDKGCSFLNEVNMCSLHQEYDSSILCDTCAIHPRETNCVDGIFEVSATTACPEISRLALLNQEGIEFSYSEEPLYIRMTGKLFFNQDKHKKNTAEYYTKELRNFSIEILQNRSYKLSERMILLGNFLNEVNKLIQENHLVKLPDFISFYRDSLKRKIYNNFLRQLPNNIEYKIHLLTEIINERLALGENTLTKRYRECLDELDRAIITGSNRVNELKHGNREYFQPFLNKNSYIFENYLVNYVFKNLFPLGNGRSMMNEFMLLVIHYSLINFHLIGMAMSNRDLSIDMSVKLIQSLSKILDHYPDFTNHIVQLLESNGINTYAHAIILIQDDL